MRASAPCACAAGRMESQRERKQTVTCRAPTRRMINKLACGHGNRHCPQGQRKARRRESSPHFYCCVRQHLLFESTNYGMQNNIFLLLLQRCAEQQTGGGPGDKKLCKITPNANMKNARDSPLGCYKFQTASLGHGFTRGLEQEGKPFFLFSLLARRCAAPEDMKFISSINR